MKRVNCVLIRDVVGFPVFVDIRTEQVCVKSAYCGHDEIYDTEKREARRTYDGHGPWDCGKYIEGCRHVEEDEEDLKGAADEDRWLEPLDPLFMGATEVDDGEDCPDGVEGDRDDWGDCQEESQLLKLCGFCTRGVYWLIH